MRAAKNITADLRPNAGAQDQFVRSTEQFPALVMGQGGGKTVGGAIKLIVNHAAFPGVDSLVIEPTFSNLRQIAIPTLVEWLDRAGIPHRVNLSDMLIYTPDLGNKMLLHSGSAAERITGFEVGRTWIDEPSRIPDYEIPQRNTWKNALARTRDSRVPAPLRYVGITGTHEGMGTWVYRDWESKHKKRGHVVYRGSTLQNPGQLEYARMLFEEYGEELARQYIGGYAVEDATPAIPYDVLLAIVTSSAERGPEGGPDIARLERAVGPLYIGMDIGRTKSLTVFWIFEDLGTVLRTAAVIEMRRAEFATQAEVIKQLIALPRFARMAIDATYNPQTAEDALAYGGPTRIDPVIFTARSKVEMAVGLIRRAQARTIEIPGDEDILADWYSVKRVVSSLGAVSYHAPFTADGHADRFFAAALACKAAGAAVTTELDWTPGLGLRSAQLRRT